MVWSDAARAAAVVTFISVADLRLHNSDISGRVAQSMIKDAVAKAAIVAPCILTPKFQADELKMAALKAILRGAILRWHDSGSGALSSYSVSAGPYSQSESFDTRQLRRTMYWPTEIQDLQRLCAPGKPGDAFIVDMTGLPRRRNPLEYAVINADPGREPMGTWAPGYVPYGEPPERNP